MFVGDISKIIHESVLMFTMSEKWKQIHTEFCNSYSWFTKHPWFEQWSWNIILLVLRRVVQILVIWSLFI